MTAIEELIAQVEFFVWSEKNQCWPTAKRWTLAEAKAQLRVAAKNAKADLSPPEELTQ